MTTNRTQHTPGPWLVEGARHIWAPGANANVASVSSPRKGTLVGYYDIGIDDPDYREACANARLIASAPDLLAACEAVVAWYENSGSTDPAPGSVELWTMCRAAIAKATER